VDLGDLSIVGDLSLVATDVERVEPFAVLLLVFGAGDRARALASAMARAFSIEMTGLASATENTRNDTASRILYMKTSKPQRLARDRA